MKFHSTMGTMYYEDHGSEHARTVACIHGVGMDHRTFAAQVDTLQKNYRVITLDLPGHGASDDIPGQLPFSSTSGRIIIELLDHLRISEAVLIGQSLGSFVAQQISAHDPGRVKASVHIGGGSLYPKYSPLLHLLRPLIFFSLTIFPKNLLVRFFAEHKALKPGTRCYLKETVSANGKTIGSMLK